MKNRGNQKSNIAMLLVFALATAFLSGCMKVATVGFSDIISISYAEGLNDSSVEAMADMQAAPLPPYTVDEPATIVVKNIDDSITSTDAAIIEPVATVSDFVPEPTISAAPTATPKSSPQAATKSTPSPSPTISVESIDDKAGYVNAKSANLRKGPDTTYEIMGEYKQYEELIITGKSGEWYRVKIDGQRGYMLSEFIEFGSVPTPTPRPTATPKPIATSTPSLSTGVPSGNGFTEEEVYLLAQLVHREANGTSLEAQKAVANAIYNRVVSNRFPSTVNGVIFQKNQYSPAKDEAKLRSTVPSQTSMDAVIAIFVNGELSLPANVTFFKSASSGITWDSISFLKYYATIGANAFFMDTRDG